MPSPALAAAAAPTAPGCCAAAASGMGGLLSVAVAGCWLMSADSFAWRACSRDISASSDAQIDSNEGLRGVMSGLCRQKVVKQKRQHTH